MSLKYKILKDEFLRVIKDKNNNIGIRDVVFNEIVSIRNYPAIRFTFDQVTRSDDQVIQTGQQIVWEYTVTMSVLFKGTESEQTSDKMMMLTDKVYDIIQGEKDINKMLHHEICDIDVMGIEYSSEPSDKGFIYSGTLEVILTIIENR